MRHQDVSAVANSVTTMGGHPRATPFSPFNPSNSYTKEVCGGSLRLDGTGDHVQVISNGNDSDLFDPTVTMTMEGWFYHETESVGTRYIFSKGGTAAGWGTSGHSVIVFTYNGVFYIQYASPHGSGFTQMTSSAGFPVYAYMGIIGLLQMMGQIVPFLNGVRAATSTNQPYGHDTRVGF